MSREIPAGLLKPEAAAKKMGVDYTTFKAGIKAGVIPAIPLGRMHLIPEEALKLLMKYGQDWVKVAQAEKPRLGYSVTELAEALGVSPALVRESIYRHELASFKLGDRVIIPAEAINEKTRAAIEEVEQFKRATSHFNIQSGDL